MHKMLLLLAAHLAYARSGKPSQTEDGDWGELSEACDDKINVGASTRTLHCIALYVCVCADSYLDTSFRRTSGVSLCLASLSLSGSSGSA